MKPYILPLLLLLAACKPQPRQQIAPPPAPAATETPDWHKPLLEMAYRHGYDEGYARCREGKQPTIMESNSHRYLEEDERKKYVEGYMKGSKDGYSEYCHFIDSVAKANPVKPKVSTLPKGYQDGYEDGYEDGCDNDYKDSWNPRSNNRQYLIDYNEGYNEGFESGRMDYIEDYYLEGDFEEDWW